MPSTRNGRVRAHREHVAPVALGVEPVAEHVRVAVHRAPRAAPRARARRSAALLRARASSGDARSSTVPSSSMACAISASSRVEAGARRERRGERRMLVAVRRDEAAQGLLRRRASVAGRAAPARRDRRRSSRSSSSSRSGTANDRDRRPLGRGAPRASRVRVARSRASSRVAAGRQRTHPRRAGFAHASATRGGRRARPTRGRAPPFRSLTSTIGHGGSRVTARVRSSPSSPSAVSPPASCGRAACRRGLLHGRRRRGGLLLLSLAFAGARRASSPRRCSSSTPRTGR